MRWSTPMVLFGIWCIVLLLGGEVAAERADTIDLFAMNQLPSARHPLGTDALGRDMLTALLVGGKTSLTIGLSAALMAVVGGTLVGTVSGYVGGALDMALMRLLDTMRAVPTLLLLLFWQAMTDPSLGGVAFILGAVGWLYTARVIRAETHIYRECAHVQVAQMMGIGTWTILWRHILPYTAERIRILFLLELSGAMAMEAAISFLGMGLPLHLPSPGTMLNHAMSGVLLGHWWQAFLPGAMLVITLVLVHGCIAAMKRDTH